MPRLIGLTGPSMFSEDCIEMIEDFYDACPVALYHSKWSNLHEMLKRCEAVFLAGGLDIHPRSYGKDCIVGKNMRKFDYDRDQREMLVMQYCIENDIPMFGICRGMQLLGVIDKEMTLLPDIAAESIVVHSPSRQDPKFEFEKKNSIHCVKIIQGRDFPPHTLWVNSFHHQGILYDAKKHASDHTIVGTSNLDDKEMIVELMVCKERKWMGCQWHPEWDYKEQEASRVVLKYFEDEFLTNKR